MKEEGAFFHFFLPPSLLLLPSKPLVLRWVFLDAIGKETVEIFSRHSPRLQPWVVVTEIRKMVLTI